MQRSLKFFACAFLMITVSSLPAKAQGLIEVSGGYNFLRLLDDQLPDDQKNFAKGFYGDIAVGHKIAVVGQVTGNYKSVDGTDLDVKLHSFMGGVRLGGSATHGAVPFVQVLGGSFRTSVGSSGFDVSNSDGALQVGVGVNMLPAGGVGLRLGADYIRVFTEGDASNAIRFGAGIVFRH